MRKVRLYIIEYSPNLNPKDVITEILGGTHISLIDPLVYPVIESTIHDYLDAFRLQKDDYNAKKMEVTLNYIREEPNRQAIERMLTMTVKPPPPPPPVLSPEEVETEVNLILQSEEVRSYPEDELPLILEGLRKRRRECIERKDYLGANKAEHLAQIALSHGQLSAVEAIEESKCRFYQTMIDEGREILAQKEERWAALRESMRESEQRDYAEMEERHATELEALEALKEEVPVGGRKFSAALLQLRRREEAMVATRKFREAAKMKAQADEMEAQEKEIMKKKWCAEVDQRIENAKTAYERQLRSRKLFWAGEIAGLVSHAEREGALANLALGHLQETLTAAEKARELTSNLKRQNESKQGDTGGSVTGRTTPRARATAHGQRRILNSKIYTRTSQATTRKKVSTPPDETW
jgi:hypothetical protein